MSDERSEQNMLSRGEVNRLADALAAEIATTTEPLTASLVAELVRRPGTQGHRSAVLGHDVGWRELVWRAVDGCTLIDDAPMVTSRGRNGR
jgi:hypothetical protein